MAGPVGLMILHWWVAAVGVYYVGIGFDNYMTTYVDEGLIS